MRKELSLSEDLLSNFHSALERKSVQTDYRIFNLKQVFKIIDFQCEVSLDCFENYFSFSS